MKFTLTWKVAQILLLELQKKFESSLQVKLDNQSTSYYFLTKRERETRPTAPTIGYELMNFLEVPNEGSEKAVYNYVYIPATKRRDQTFSRKSLYPGLFLNYLGFKDLKEFLKYCEDESLLSPEDITHQLNLLEDKSTGTGSLNFKFFYFDGKHLKLGLLNVTTYSNVHLSFYSNEKNNTLNYYGKLEGQHSNITNILLTRQDSNDKVFICLNTGQYGLTRASKLVTGTFAGTSKNSRPIGGQVFMELLTPEESTHFDIKNSRAAISSADPRIALHLSQKYIATSDKIPKDYGALISVFNKKIKAFQGTYISYTIHNTEHCIIKSIFKINTDYTVKATHNGDDYHGTLRFHPSGKALVMDVKTENGHYFYQTVFQLNDSRNDRLLGIYAGVSKNNLPISGKQILIRSENETEKLRSKVIKLEEDTYRKLKKEFPIIEDYFSGRLPNCNFTDSSRMLKKIKSIARSGNNLRYLSGTYKVFFRSTENTIRKYALEIKENGSINFRGLQFYRGSFHVKDNNLIINIYENGGQAYLQQMIFHFLPNSNKGEKLKNTIGIYSGLSVSRAPLCVRCILQRTNKTFEKVDVEQFSLDLDIGQSIPESFLTYLKHETPNIMMTDKKSDYSDEYFNDVIDYGEVFFNSSCYLAQQYELEKNTPSKKKAILNKIFKHITLSVNSISDLDYKIFEHFNFRKGRFETISNSLKNFFFYNKTHIIYELLSKREAPPRKEKKEVETF